MVYSNYHEVVMRSSGLSLRLHVHGNFFAAVIIFSSNDRYLLSPHTMMQFSTPRLTVAVIGCRPCSKRKKCSAVIVYVDACSMPEWCLRCIMLRSYYARRRTSTLVDVQIEHVDFYCSIHTVHINMHLHTQCCSLIKLSSIRMYMRMHRARRRRT